jgi:hypothetical protein
MKDPRAGLVAALEQLILLAQEVAKEWEEARQRQERIRAYAESRSSWNINETEWLDFLRDIDASDPSTPLKRAALGDMAFLDALHCLMRLAEEPELRAPAYRIYALLRQFKLSPALACLEVAPPPSKSDEAQDFGKFKRIARIRSGWVYQREETDRWLDRYLETSRQRAEENCRLLHQALQIAKEIEAAERS